MPHPRRLILVATLLSFLTSAPLLAAPPPDQLGKINLPTSCSAAVQPTIEKGVALLHSFQYKESEQTFTDAATREPKCAMAHWGKAMALYYQLWEFPNDKKLKEGRKDVDQARKQHNLTPREQGFITAAAAFFQKSKLSHAERTAAYSSVLEKFFAYDPVDVEGRSFYALSLVSLAYVDDKNEMAHRQKAISVLDPLLKQFPDHPGVAHYMIHATDRPDLAAQGLEAARRYAAI